MRVNVVYARVYKVCIFQANVYNYYYYYVSSIIC